MAKSVCFARKQEQSDYRRHSHRVYHAKDILIRNGDPLVGLYALRSGAAKSLVTISGGQEQIVHFHYPGDLLGTDGFGTQYHINTVQFLDTSSVCFFKLNEIDLLMAESEEIRARLLKAMSAELTDDHQNLLSLSQLSSAQRMARFILEHSDRCAARGLCASQFDLVMNRTDIANHLGLAIETVSRLLKRFHRDKIIDIQQRHLTILDMARLQSCITFNDERLNAAKPA
ncbi:MAG: helix-turn-helix domain-containing protein [Aestuariibacter sp.]